MSNRILGENYVDICRDIRKAGKENKVEVRNDGESWLNGCVSKLFEDCNISIKEAINEYLSKLQPFNIKRFKQDGKGSKTVEIKDICNMIGIVVTIKGDNSITASLEEVEFTETEYLNDKCIIINNCEDKFDGKSMVEFTVQSGGIKRNLKCYSFSRDKDTAVIKYLDIINDIDDYIDSEIDRVEKEYYNGKFVGIRFNIKNEVVTNKGSSRGEQLVFLLDYYNDGEQRDKIIAMSIVSYLLNNVTCIIKSEALARIEYKISKGEIKTDSPLYIYLYSILKNSEYDDEIPEEWFEV